MEDKRRRLYSDRRTGLYDYIRTRDRPLYNLMYAIKEQAFIDLAKCKTDKWLNESTESLIHFCKTFFVENEHLNDVLLSKALKSRALYMIEKLINELENLQLEVVKMKMQLSRMYDDMINSYTPEQATAPVMASADADAIEEKLEQAQAQTQTQAPADTQTQAPADATDTVAENESEVTNI